MKRSMNALATMNVLLAFTVTETLQKLLINTCFNLPVFSWILNPKFLTNQRSNRIEYEAANPISDLYNFLRKIYVLKVLIKKCILIRKTLTNLKNNA